jgi:homoserine kinase
VIVRAPATSANLGPGFDCIAVALDLWNELEVSEGEPGRVSVEVLGEGAGELPAGESNLVVRAYSLLASPQGKRFRLRNRIPLERGLGSSAAAIALGLVAARPDAAAEELLAHGLGLEPHADNLAAALVGGVCVTWEGEIERIADQLPLHAVVVVPPERVRTEAARARLPAVVPHEDAAFTAARALLLGAGISGFDPGLMSRGLADRLHEPYRPSALLDALRDELPRGATGATLSGSGPSVVVWAVDPAPCASELALRFPEHGVHALAVAPDGALGPGA